MSITKNMEGLFLIAAVGFTCASAFASSKALHSAVVAAPAQLETTAVIIIPGKRLTAAEKAQLDA